MTLALSIDSLVKTFGGLRAVDRFSLEVKVGSIHSVIGPNGSGKTTLVNMITGWYSIDSGKILLFDRDITGIPIHERPRVGLARTFQNLELCPYLTVLENVLLGYSMKTDLSFWKSFLFSKTIKKQEKIFEEQAVHLLKRVGLLPYLHHLDKEISYGNQKKLEIARALAMNPRFLILDEPVAGVSIKDREEVIDLIQNLNHDTFLQERNGNPITILLIEHNMRAVMSLSDWITVISFGSKLAEGVPENIQNHPAVIDAYLGKDPSSI